MSVCVCAWVCRAKQPSAPRFDGVLLWLHYTDGFGSVPGSLTLCVCVCRISHFFILSRGQLDRTHWTAQNYFRTKTTTTAEHSVLPLWNMKSEHLSFKQFPFVKSRTLETHFPPIKTKTCSVSADALLKHPVCKSNTKLLKTLIKMTANTLVYSLNLLVVKEVISWLHGKRQVKYIFK